MDGFITTAGTLFAVILILFLAYWFTRRFARGLSFREQTRYLRIIDRLPVAQDRCILLVEAGGRIYMLGATAAQISLLAEWKDGELSFPEKTEETQQPDFRELLKRMGGRKKDGY